ncbi:MATE family efflux transporter [Sphingomonadaceae bacterium OTU29MARTA1]|uniref:MATE family efflux transporter n=1 Tax=Sphingomonas sp. Leaf37 TaxID=2876552 RepID=UPI001E32B7E8|nr:MATE family efflux transporter [Sphingomonas sp. Leaf37]USU09302.1 MATE family efflux transporter [Sphingomonadaceae bacterium OTU29MARTA1]
MPKPQRDLTTGAIGGTLLAFALPTLGSNILQSLNGSINAIWVGRFLGEGALAATSNANIIMFLMFGAVFGFGMAATILVGQSFGRRDIEGGRRAFGAAIGLVLMGSVVIAIIGWLFSAEILRLLATPGDAMELAQAYLQVIFLGLPASMLLVLIMMGLRGTGDSLTPLWFMGLSVVLDSGLNPLLIAGIGPFPRLGIAGSAWATLIANHLAVAGLVFYVYAKDLPIRLKGPELAWIRPGRDLAVTIVRKGLPMAAQMLVMSSAGLTMVGLVNRQGVDTAAAYAVSQQLWTYIQMPALAIGAAVSAMAAQNIGANRWDRVASITRYGVLYNIALTGVMVAAVILFDRTVMTLFVPTDSPALPIARHIQLIASWNFVVFGVTMVLFSTVRANGAVLAPLLFLFISMYPVRIGFALGTRDWLGVDALWWSFPVGSVVNLVMAALYYRYGNWRRGNLVVAADPGEAHEHSHTVAEPGGRMQPSG